MFSKALLVLALVALAQASLPIAPVVEPYDANPNYSFEYHVNDPTTGDTKSQSETRSGDTVTGSYSLVEPDGVTRTVDYSADPLTGFVATVSKTGGTAPALNVAPKYIAPVAPVYHAPVYHAPIAPVYHAPVSVTAYHAPIYRAPIVSPVYHAPVPAYHPPYYPPVVKYPYYKK